MNHVPVGLLYRTTGSPNVRANGLWPLALVIRLKVSPPSVDIDAPEKLLKLGASRIVESDDDLIGVIRVGRGECLRLRRVGECLGSSDQVDVPSTIRQGRGDGSSFWTSWEKALVGAPLGYLRVLAAVKHEKSPFKALHPVDALLVNGGTVKSRRKTLDVDNFSVLCSAGAEFAVTAVNVPSPPAPERRRPAE